jgi:DNA-binding response OmpR family regulator
MSLVTRARKPAILVVDDEPKLVAFLRRALSAHGFAVDCATNSGRALELLAKRDYELVLVSGLMDVESKVRLFAQVAARLQLSANRNGTQATLRHNGLVLDLRRKVVETSEGVVKLSEREFHLLRHLLLCEGEVCSRAELLEEVWGYSFDPGSNVVDVYVGRLRAKLGSSVIATVRNVGYYVPAGPS